MEVQMSNFGIQKLIKDEGKTWKY